MKRIGEEWTLDWYNTRGGRTIIKPTFGERVDVLHLYRKDAPKEKIINTKKSILNKLQSKYIRTYIETSKGITILNRVVVFRECANIFQGVQSVYYENGKGMFSKLYKS
jgi:hypothetical protein